LLADVTISERQKQVLLEIYTSFRAENESSLAADLADEPASHTGT
jgi:hypothetical protein